MLALGCLGSLGFENAYALAMPRSDDALQELQTLRSGGLNNP